MAPEGGMIHGFEANQNGFASGDGLTLANNADLSYVRYGLGSLRASYNLSQLTSASGARRQAVAELSVPLPDEADHVGLWIWGDGSGNSFSLRFSDGTTETSQWLCQLDFTGWKYVTASIPTGAAEVTGLAITEYD